MKETFKINLGSGGKGAESDNDKKQTNILAAIFKGLGPLAILYRVKFIQDLLDVIVGFVGLGILEIIKFFKFIYDWASTIKASVGNFFKNLGQNISDGLEKVITGLGDILSKWFEEAISWLKNLPMVFNY